MLAQVLRQGHAQAVIPVTGQLLATQKVQQPEHAATPKATTHPEAIPEQHITAVAKAHKQLQAALAEAQTAVIPFRQLAVHREAILHLRAVQAVREAVRATKAVHRAAQAAVATNQVVAVHLQGAVVAVVAIRHHREAVLAVVTQAEAAHVVAIQVEAAQAHTVREAAHRAAVVHRRHHLRVADVSTKERHC